MLATIGLAAPASAAEPWRAADRVAQGLFDAQTELVLSTPARAGAAAREAAGAYSGELRSGLRRVDPAADRAVRDGLRRARAAGRAGDATALAAARGAVRAALFRGAYAVTTRAAGAGDAATARRWLLLREYRTATRFTRPGANATLAVEQLAQRRLSPGAARQAIVKDLLDAYQSRLRELLDDAARGAAEDLPARRAEASAQAAGYYAILAPRYAEDRGAAAERSARDAFAQLQRAGAEGAPRAAFEAILASARASLEGFTAAPFTPAEAARRAQQLLRFLALVPVEYGRGVKGRKVTLDFEVQEAVAFRTGSEAAFADLRDQLAKRDKPQHRGGRESAVRRPQADGRGGAEAPRRRRHPRRGGADDRRDRRRASTRRCRRSGSRRPTSPTTT